MKLNIDGIDFDTATPEFVQAVQKVMLDAKSRIDALEAQNKDLTAKLAQVRTPEAIEAEIVKRVEEQMSKRLDTRARAIKVLGAEYKFDGKTDREVMLAAIATSDKAFKADGKSDEYVAGVFDRVLSSVSVQIPREQGDRKDSDNDTGPTGDGSYYDRVRKDSQERLANAWQTTAPATK